MKTQCTRPAVRFQALSGREVVAAFDGGMITSDAGFVLLERVDRRLDLLRRVAGCFTDQRDASRTKHSVLDLITQRIFGLCAGYEDLVDHDVLRVDPLLGQLVGRRDQSQLASSSTLNRMELSADQIGGGERYKKVALDTDKLDELFVTMMIEAHSEEPDELIIDLDATDVPLFGQQEARFYHGYYKHHCYLPLYIFAGDHLLSARLRPSNIDGAKGSLEEVQRIVQVIRRSWPKTRLIMRADSGFCRDDFLSWCEETNGVDYIIGLPKNARLKAEIADIMGHAKDLFEIYKRASRIFGVFPWRTRDSWTRTRTVVAKAEHLAKGENPRFIVTSLECPSTDEAKRLYEDVYCARGDMENRIKEQQNYLFADRLSASALRANQVRVYMSAIG